MFDVTNKIYTNSLKEDINEALSLGKVIVSISINNNEYPKKIYSRSPWILKLENNKATLHFTSTNKEAKKVIDLEDSIFYLEVDKGFNNAPGPFMTQTICFELSIKHNDITYSFICEDLNAIPEVLKFIENNKIAYVDNHKLNDLYKEFELQEVSQILYDQLDNIKDKTLV